MPSGNKLCIFISIHAPLRERQRGAIFGLDFWKHFNPRSLTGATTLAERTPLHVWISIHAPLRERLKFAVAGYG